MRYFEIAVILCLATSTAHCQWQPALSVSYGALYVTPNNESQFLEFEVGGGISLNHQFSFLIKYRQSRFGLGLNLSNYERMRNHIIEASFGYRILDNSRSVSPRVMLDFGTPLTSNANDTLILNGFYIIDHYDLGVHRYNRGLFFGKLKALCDIKIESVNLMIGGSYNLFVYNWSSLKSKYGPPEGDYEVVKDYTSYKHNFGLEVGLMYTFPEKKKKGE